MKELDFFAFEAGLRNKPDEKDSLFANKLTAYALSINPHYKLNIRVNGQANSGKPVVELSGEVSKGLLAKPFVAKGFHDVVRDTYNELSRSNISLDDITLINNLKPQSDELAANASKHHNGDTGETVAFALRNSPLYLPDERFLAVELRNLFDSIFFNAGKVPGAIAQYARITSLPGLRGDGKVSVRALFKDNVLERVPYVTIALHHEKQNDFIVFQNDVKKITKGFFEHMSNHFYNERSIGVPYIVVNGAGSWDGLGGWDVDKGHNEAKPHRDWFGMRGVGEDSGSGENANKMSLLGTLLARYAAVQLVGHNLAPYARVSLTYNIGDDGIADIFVSTNNSAHKKQAYLVDFVNEVIPSSLDDVIDLFGLKNAETYNEFANNADFFHGPYVWNSVNDDL